MHPESLGALFRLRWLSPTLGISDSVEPGGGDPRMGICNTFPAEAEASSGPGTTLGEHCCPLGGGGRLNMPREKGALLLKKEKHERLKQK